MDDVPGRLLIAALDSFGTAKRNTRSLQALQDDWPGGERLGGRQFSRLFVIAHVSLDYSKEPRVCYISQPQLSKYSKSVLRVT